MAFGRVQPGQSASRSPARSAAWLNAVSEATEYFQQRIVGGQPQRGSAKLGQAISVVKVRNVSGANRRRGDVLQLGASLLTSINPRSPWFQADAVGATTGKIAILRAPLKSNEIGEAQRVGVCVAYVNVTSTSDTHAGPQAGSYALVSGKSGPAEILSPLSTTGEQELIVSLGGGGGGSTRVYGKLIEDVPGRGAVAAAVQLEIWNGETMADDGDPIYGFNRSFQNARGSAALPAAVEGELVTIDVIEGEATVQYDCLLFRAEDLAILPGALVTTVGNVPQMPFKQDGTRQFTLDGGPCE